MSNSTIEILQNVDYNGKKYPWAVLQKTKTLVGTTYEFFDSTEEMSDFLKKIKREESKVVVKNDNIDDAIKFVKNLNFHCLRCNHTWLPKTTKKPKVCPNCNSPYWDKKRGWYKKKKNVSNSSQH